MSVDTYGVTEATLCEDSLARCVEELQISGFTIIEDVLDKAEVDRLRECLDEVYRRQVDEVGGVEVLDQLNDADVVRCPLSYDPTFLALSLNETLLELSRRVLGPNIVLLMQNGVINDPASEQYQKRWHRDLNYQHWVATKPLSLHFMFCLDDFSEETGGTVVLPGSHLQGAFPSDEFVTKHQRTATARAGSMIVGNAMLYHRSGTNSSAQLRRGVNHVVGLPFISQQIDIPEALSRAGIEPPESARDYLGFRWRPKASVLAWRQARIDE